MKKLQWYFSIFLLPSLLFCVENLTYTQAVALVKQNNHEIKIAEFSKKIEELKKEEINGKNYGSLDFIQSYARSNDALNVFGFKLQSREASFKDFGFSEFDMTNPNLLHVKPEDLNNPKTRGHFRTTLQYKLPLYTGGKLSQYEKMQEVFASLKKLDKQSVINQKLFEVKKTFYAVALLRSYEKNLLIIKENIQILEDMTKEMIKEGYAKNVDLLEVQVKKANIERMLHQSRVNKRLLYHFLTFLLGEEVTSIEKFDSNSYDLQISDKEILTNNLDIQKAKKATKLSELNQKAMEASLLPEVGLFAEYGSSDDAFLDDFNAHDAYTLGVEFRWNLFKGGSHSSLIEQARVGKLKAKEQLMLAKEGIKLKVAKIRTRIKSLEVDIESLRKELELARSIYQNYLGRYQEKIASINDVIIKQSEEIAKVLQLKELQNRRNEKLFQLEKLANGEYSETIY